MYRCYHCNDLHVSAEQARVCSTADGDLLPELLQEVDRILQRGPIPLWKKHDVSAGPEWTMPERRLWNSLEALLPGEVRTQWWIPGCDHRIDLFVPSVSMAIEVEEEPRRGGVGPDRLRASVLRSHGVTILRVPGALAMSDSERIASFVAERVHDQAPQRIEAIPA